MICWRSTQAVAILPVLVIIFLYIATKSYGTRRDVYLSWYGGDIEITPDYYRVVRDTDWVSDRKYLMWKDIDPVKVRGFSLLANLAYRGYDDGYSFLVPFTAIFSLIDVGVIWLTWKPFK